MRAIFLALLIATAPGAAFAYCNPDTDYSVKAEFARSDIVAVVKVIRARWYDEHRNPVAAPTRAPLGLDPYAGVVYRVDVVRTFKGSPSRTLAIFSENTSARTPLEMGERYVVFLQRQTLADENRRVGDLMIDVCGNSAALRHAGAVMTVLNSPAR
jgi:hypothetical protein